MSGKRLFLMTKKTKRLNSSIFGICMNKLVSSLEEKGLYRSSFERENCGFGLLAQLDGIDSHELLLNSITALARMTHRGAIAADGKTGDGCGLLMQAPKTFLKKVAAECELKLADRFAVSSVFLSQESAVALASRNHVEQAVLAQGFGVAGWRLVPVDSEACGLEALASMPLIQQLFINIPDDMDEAQVEQKLFLARRRSEIAVGDSDDHFYIASMSSKVLSYKGLVMPERLPEFYIDLNDPDFKTAICVFHQRFSTNTWPQWRLAQPFRLLAHNGEINTLMGNRYWSIARQNKFSSLFDSDAANQPPLVSMTGSDSMTLDNMLDVLLASDIGLFRAMRLLVPPAWQNVKTMDPDLRAFYEYNSMHMEPWDGPAGIVFTDGRYAACTLDRNGLRPARYVITKDRVIILASEVGVYDYEPADVAAKGRLKPGEIIAADTETGKLLLPRDIDDQLKNEYPYREWLERNVRKVGFNAGHTDEGCLAPAFDAEALLRYEKSFYVTFEECDQVIRVLGENGQEAIGSMGDDTPIPAMSMQVRALFDCFRQQFAQVTNPPIDPLREKIVMSLETCFGKELSLLSQTENHAQRITTPSPVLSSAQFRHLTGDVAQLEAQVLDLSYDRPDQVDGTALKAAIERLCQEAESAVRSGAVVLVLNDRNIERDKIPVHAALATGAVHHHLTERGLRCDANLIVATGWARDPHHFAVLLGLGATAIYPYLGFAILQGMVNNGALPADLTEVQVCKNYVAGIEKGLYKIISKMGISAISSYRGAQLFEAIGLHSDVVNKCCKGMVSRIQGANFSEIEQDQAKISRDAWIPRKPIHQGGQLKYIHGGEQHAYNPDVVTALQKAVQSGDYQHYLEYASLVNNRVPLALRDNLRLKDGIAPVPLEEVEAIENILPRFDSAGMSLGALSPEAHEALAEAMNNLGGRSNSGEGGEDPARYGTSKMSKIKQVASGRFGVTPAYLVNAEMLQIKIAQGAKPGEGGQLPGTKVNELIARLRHCNPGTTLISPPPHHDIYSIEDLAQLIFDLKQVNPNALVSVKLVAEAGVGTVAAGVAKAYADHITISGHDGGTGASPLTSVKYAGAPWELGLAETHQALCANDLRGKVQVQTDGGLKTGLDVIKAAILGAESFGFGTGPMIALGCKYLRICHLNNCATGIATQVEELRKEHYIGLPQMVENYFNFIAEETREWMAKLGVTSLEQLIGRTDLLEYFPGKTAKQQNLDLSPILSARGLFDNKAQFCELASNEPFDKGELAETMVADTVDAITNKLGGIFHYRVKNVDRSIGARLSGEIARRYGNHGMDNAPITVKLRGSAGQSFGVWNAGGLHLELEGDANDYVGKGMAGGKLVVYPPKNSSFSSHTTAIIGNTCLYGATGGKLFAAGMAGERFAVRNSGALAVVEGIGDHGCEYMTGGVIVVLGQAGLNFGAAMTGGIAFVLDSEDTFSEKYNDELVNIHRITDDYMTDYRNYLRAVMDEYVEETGSVWGQKLVTDFQRVQGQFWLVTPKSCDVSNLLGQILNGTP